MDPKHIEVRTSTWFPRGSVEGRTLTAFIDAVEDLRRRSAATATEYDVFQSSGLVRRLIMDGTPIALRAGRIVGVTPSFEWSVNTFIEKLPNGEHVRIPGPYFDPGLAVTVAGDVRDVDERSLRRGSVETFLAAPVIELRDDPDLTVRDVVRWAAHHRGGVHWEMAGPADAAVVQRLDYLYRHRSSRVRWSVLGVARVVYRAVEPVIYAALARTLYTTAESSERA